MKIADSDGRRIDRKERFFVFEGYTTGMSDWSVHSIPDCSDKTAVITGANSGLGFEATAELARNGARVVMACRNIDRGESAREEIEEAVENASLSVRELDLASLDSVRSFAESVTESFDRIDILCNNAGIMAVPWSETEDGFETQFGVNHLGHFALTGQLLGTLAAAPEPRVVTQSSKMHVSGEIDFDDPHGKESYSRWEAYAQSKLANVLFAYELDRRYGDTVTSVACHPGWAATNLQRRAPEQMGSRLRIALMKLANRLIAQSAEKGALPMLYAATASDVEGGEYIGPDGRFQIQGQPEKQESSSRSYDEETAAQLWELSKEQTGVEYDGIEIEA